MPNSCGRWDVLVTSTGCILITADTRCSLGLGLAGLMLCYETQSCHARRRNDLEGHSNFLSPIYSFSVLC